MPHATVMMPYHLLLILISVMTQRPTSAPYGSAAAYASSTVTATTLSPVTHTINVAKASLEYFEPGPSLTTSFRVASLSNLM
jgi:hypothetical protein